MNARLHVPTNYPALYGNHVQNYHSIYVQRTARSSLLLIIIQHIVHKLVQLHVE